VFSRPPGYTLRNVPRVWTYETAVLLGADIKDALPCVTSRVPAVTWDVTWDGRALAYFVRATSRVPPR
jgi:hypothetical protein